MIPECVMLLWALNVRISSGDIVMSKLTMNNGVEMPPIALGTYLGISQNGSSPSPNVLPGVIELAIDIGYRNFDTASVYGNEEEVGKGIRRKIKEGAVKREDVFVITKLWNTDHRRNQVEPALRRSLKLLGLDYVDLYLMHWPIGLNEDYTPSDVDFMETWRGMEDVYKQGLARSIGVSNFNKDQLERALREGSVTPAVLQIEVHPQIGNHELVEYAQAQGLVVMGFSPFGSLVRRYGYEMPGPKIDDPTLVGIAEKYGKTTPQVVLRWLVDRKIVPIAKTVTPKRLKENINIFDFRLNEEEMKKIDTFDTITRFTLPSFWQHHKYYPFEKIAEPVPDPFVNRT